MSNINNLNHINRGVEIILNGGKKKQPKDFHIIYEKLVLFLRRELTIYFEFSLSFRKKNTFPEKKNVSN